MFYANSLYSINPQLPTFFIPFLSTNQTLRKTFSSFFAKQNCMYRDLKYLSDLSHMIQYLESGEISRLILIISIKYTIMQQLNLWVVQGLRFCTLFHPFYYFVGWAVRYLLSVPEMGQVCTMKILFILSYMLFKSKRSSMIVSVINSSGSRIIKGNGLWSCLWGNYLD